MATLFEHPEILAAPVMSPEMLRALDGVDEAVAIFTAEDFPVGARIVYANEATIRLTGYEPDELVGHSALLLAGARPDGAHVRRVRAAAESGEPVPFHGPTRKFRPDGTSYDVLVHVEALRDSSGEVTHFVTIQRDLGSAMRERAAMEARLLLAERGASLGRLAVAAAFEMDAPLSCILSELDVALTAVVEHPELAQIALARARSSALMVRETARQQRAVSDLDERSLVSLDVHEALETAVSLVWPEMGERACLTRSYTRLPRVRANLGRLTLTFVNLLRNAVAAIPPALPIANGIRIETRVSSDGGAIVEISDTGIGIERADLKRVFDPFFTTKPEGRAFGLGLTVARAAVLEVGGNIAVDSVPGRGTCFRVTLPAESVLDEEAPLPFYTSEELPERRVLAAARTRVRARELGMMFEDGRARVVVATEEEALEALSTGEAFDLVVCDGRAGSSADFIERLRALAPECLGRVFAIRGAADNCSGVYRVG